MDLAFDKRNIMAVFSGLQCKIDATPPATTQLQDSRQILAVLAPHTHLGL